MSSYGSWSAWYLVLRAATNIETVELGDAVLRNELRDAWIALRHPSEELGDTHGCGWSIAIAW
jgi:hypothetical protein